MAKTILYDEHIRKAISEIDFRLKNNNGMNPAEYHDSIIFKNRLLEKLKEIHQH